MCIRDRGLPAAKADVHLEADIHAVEGNKNGFGAGAVSYTHLDVYKRQALRKGQASAFYYGDPLGEMRLVSRVFEM